MRRSSQGATAWAAVDQKRDGWEAVIPWVLALTILLGTLGGSAAVAAPLSADMIVSVPDQVLALVDRGKLIARYSISTSKFGTGDSAASYRTPLGTLFVSAKIGDRLPPGAVIKNRIPTGEIVGGRCAGARRNCFARDLAARNGNAKSESARPLYLHSRNTGGAPDRQPGELRLHPDALTRHHRPLRSRPHRHTRPDHATQDSRFR